jgi:hypothetical protein
MELALIPPTPLLLLNDAHKYQLMLPHMLKDQEYASAYWDYCQDNNKYVILDNGAAEQSPYETKALLAIAKQFMVDEMVVPDVMGDWNETVTAASLFAREQAVEAGVCRSGQDSGRSYHVCDQHVHTPAGWQADGRGLCAAAPPLSKQPHRPTEGRPAPPQLLPCTRRSDGHPLPRCKRSLAR